MLQYCNRLCSIYGHFLLKGTFHASNILVLNLITYWKSRNGTEGLHVGLSELLKGLGVPIL